MSKVSFLNLVHATTDAFEALEMLNREPIDLLLIDIEMPDITGIELIKSLNNPAVNIIYNSL